VNDLIEDYDIAFENTIGLEGSYTNDPNDPGGETNWGLSKKSNPDLDIKNLTKEQAKTIYKERYWNKINGDLLPYPINIIGFDRSVLYGTGKANEWIKQSSNAYDLLFYSLKYTISIWNLTYLKGWLNRIIYLWENYAKPKG
jgi:lysozyme family protein